MHLQKNRSGPALALFKLAHANLQKFPDFHEGLDLAAVLAVIEHWMGKLASAHPDDALCESAIADLRLPLPAERM